MPDRYGDQPANDEGDEFGPAYRRRAQDAIDECGLCDSDGLRNGFPCDHVDYGAIAKRGIDAVRAALRKEAQ